MLVISINPMKSVQLKEKTEATLNLNSKCLAKI